MSRVSVHEARGERAAQVAALHLDTALAAYAHIFPPEAPPPTLDELTAQWASWMTAPDDFDRRIFVAHVDGELTGVVMACRDPMERETGHVARLYVRPARWGEGAGRALLDVAVASLRAAGHAEATLWVLERNDRVRSWYERLGWRATGERKAVYEPAGIDDVRYRLTL